MSVEAITWALGQGLDRSSAKFVLVVMANCANHDMTCWPSVKYIADATGQDRKTVLGNMARLLEQDYIIDTGYRRGRTGQIPVYVLNVKKLPAVNLQDEPDDEGDGDYSAQNSGNHNAKNSTENGTAKQSQKRNSTENGTVPFFRDNSPVFPTKESRFSAVTVPKTGHGTVKEPLLNRNETHPNEIPPKKVEVSTVDGAVGLSIQFRKNNIQTQPQNPTLIALAQQGVTPELVQAACEEAKISKGDEPVHMNYVVGIINRWARQANSLSVSGAAVPGKSAAKEKFNPTAYVNKNRRKS